MTSSFAKGYTNKRMNPTADRVIAPGSRVRIEYDLSTEDEIYETTEATGPLEFELGQGRLHPAIERCLVGLRAGDPFDRLIDHSLAFGERNPDLRITLKRENLPERVRNLQLGDSFEGPGPDRKMHLFRVIRADDESYTIDGNHPLAGIDLHFQGRVLHVG